MGHIKAKMPQLTEDYYVECFISGFEEDVKQVLKLLSPSCVEGAVKKAKYCVQMGEPWNNMKVSGKTVGSREGSTDVKGKLS